MKVENAIFEEFREEIESSEARLIEAKTAQLKGVRAMCERKYAGGKLEGSLMDATIKN